MNEILKRLFISNYKRNIQELNVIRSNELNCVLEHLKNCQETSVLLEIGSGNGEQLRQLQSRFPNSRGVEIEECNYFIPSDISIEIYNGKLLPFQSETFDIIYTSHLLEHIVGIDEFLEEISRVLKKDGVFINVVPSSSWKIINVLFHFLFFPKVVLDYFSRKVMFGENLNKYRGTKNLNSSNLFFNTLFPPRHGESGNRFNEFLYFRKSYWREMFGKRFALRVCTESKVYYSGHFISCRRFRSLLSRLISSSYVIVLSKSSVQ